MMRPRESLEEAYSRSLEEEALLREIGDEGLCPSCRRFVERTWRVCPFCQTQLKDICGECEQLLSFNWVVCPHCTAERKAALRTLTPMPPPAVVTASRQEQARTAGGPSTETANSEVTPGARLAKATTTRSRTRDGRDTDDAAEEAAPKTTPQTSS
jgi:RNA polymerase subunit RPABC4/transcription elongation factor Spt4